MSAAMSSDDSKIVNYLVRMVVPLRREFGQHLDVQHFLHDLDYAQDVLKKALSSQDTRLREYGEYVSKLRLGPRMGEPSDIPVPMPKTASTSATSTPARAPAASPAQSTSGSEPTEEELRARIMKKYTSGLR
jgi:hypothetical protein